MSNNEVREPSQQDKKHDLSLPPFSHGRVVCRNCSAVVAQCRCIEGCKTVATVEHCAQCPAPSPESQQEKITHAASEDAETPYANIKRAAEEIARRTCPVCAETTTQPAHDHSARVEAIAQIIVRNKVHEPCCARCGEVKTARGGDVHCNGDCDAGVHDQKGGCHTFVESNPEKTVERAIDETCGACAAEAEGDLVDSRHHTCGEQTVETARDEWIWMPHAGHLIVGRDCRFHLFTCVGDFIVSTVGEYEPDEGVREILAKSRGIKLKGRGDVRRADWHRKIGYEEIGYGRTYETMVFRARKDPENDCCGFTADGWSELDYGAYNDAAEARKGHDEMCAKWAARTLADVAEESINEVE